MRMRTITPAVCTRPYFSRVRRIREKYGAGDEATLLQVLLDAKQ